MTHKLTTLHDEDRRTMEELAEERSSTFQELMDEAGRDLLEKHGRPTSLKDAWRQSAAGQDSFQRAIRGGTALPNLSGGASLRLANAV